MPGGAVAAASQMCFEAYGLESSVSQSVFTFAFASLFVTPISLLGQDDASDKQKRAVDQAAAAYGAGRLNEVIRILGPVLQSATPDELNAADERLRLNHGLDLSLVALIV